MILDEKHLACILYRLISKFLYFFDGPFSSEKVIRLIFDIQKCAGTRFYETALSSRENVYLLAKRKKSNSITTTLFDEQLYL